MTLRMLFRILLRAVAVLIHLVPWALWAALLSAPLLGNARAETGTDAQTCPAGKSALPALEADGRLAELRREAAETPNGTGRLFRVEKAGRAPSWLFGTMHLSDPRVLALPEPAERAFEDSRQLVIESTDILNPASMSAALLTRPDLTSLPAGEKLTDLLTPDDLAKVEPALAARAMPLGSVQTLQPWFVATSLALPPCEMARAGKGGVVLDLTLGKRAEAEGKPVAGLETAIEQLEALASPPLDMQLRNLVASVELGDRLPDIFETMVDLYLRGETGLITPATEALMPEGSNDAQAIADNQAFEDRIIHQRNAVMEERLRPLLEAGGQFVAVGALHLPGQDGLVERLRRAGWTVTRAD